MAKILVVDDDGIVRDALSVFLTRAGHEVLTAADGANGLQSFKNNPPDLVVLDRNLPAISGSGVLEHIRKISKTAPVLVLSGYNAPEDVEDYLRRGANAFLSKGGGLPPLFAEIDRLLGVQPGAKDRPTAAVEREAGSSIAPAPGAAAARVLIADDDVQVRAVLCRFLASLSYETLEAKDGAEALELARARRPDIVLLDIRMSKKNGLEVLKELAPEMPKTGFMMISGNEDEAVARECLKFGAFDYISKPINLSTFGVILKTRLLVQG